MIKLIKKGYLLVLLLIVSIVISSCDLYQGNKDPDTFDDLCNQLFVLLIGNDDLTINFLFEDIDSLNLGIETNVSLPKPSVTSIINVVAVELLFGQVKQYNYDLLSFDQKMTYNVIVDMIDNIKNNTGEYSYLSNNYLGSYLGYQAQLPILLAEYKLRNKKCVDNYLQYLKLVPETFKSYYDFEVEKANRGYGMSNFVIDKVIDQVTSFVDSIDNNTNFLFSVINDKIDNLDFLTSEEKQHYKEENINYINTYLKEGYTYIKDNLPNLYNKSINDLGLAHYVNSDGATIGKYYYEADFKHTVGYDSSCDEAIVYLDNKLITIKQDINNLTSTIKNDEQLVTIYNQIKNNELLYTTLEPEEILNKHIDSISEDFPSINATPSINIKYIDEAMWEHFSPAAYMTSPIDSSTLDEFIYLNPLKVYLSNDGKLLDTFDYNYLYTTLAHEGLPGHLYQNVYFKQTNSNIIRKVLKNIGYVEGWATYAENYSLNYLSDIIPTEVIELLKLESLYTSAIYSRLDLGIHYNGWNKEETLDYLDDYFTVSSVEDITPVFEQLVEIPNNYQQYFFTYLHINDLANEVVSNGYSIYEFHKAFLDCGPAPLKYVESFLREEFNLSK